MSIFEKDEVIRELREGHIVFLAYAIERGWWDMFWTGCWEDNIDCCLIDNAKLISSIDGKIVKKDNMYHYLSSDLTKLNIENWTGLYLDPHIQERSDYVLVNQRVWDLLKSYYGGGPEIPFFLIDDSRKQKDFNISKDSNFLFSQPYIYGFPDKNPFYLKIDFVVKIEIEQRDSEEALRVPYTLLVSRAMTFEQLIYYCACKL